MSNYEEQLNESTRLLHRYLKQYKVCIDRKKTLEERRKNIVFEFDHPLSSVVNDGMPKSQSGISVGSAGLSIRLDEIQCRIIEQSDKAGKVLLQIMDIIDLLPENEMVRAIFEHRYIDMLSWNRICMVEHISRTPATKYWRKGLYDLLNYEYVCDVLEDYKKEIEEE